MPSRVGMIYCNYDEGPQKIFYAGVIRALEDSFFLCDSEDSVKIYGDCKHVIDQLNGKVGVGDLEPFYKQVRGMERKYKKFNKGSIEYDYLNEDDEMYKKLDRCVKQFQNYLEQRIVGQKRRKRPKPAPRQ